jgi:hypothetical protein
MYKYTSNLFCFVYLCIVNLYLRMSIILRSATTNFVLSQGTRQAALALQYLEGEGETSYRNPDFTPATEIVKRQIE